MILPSNLVLRLQDGAKITDAKSGSQPKETAPVPDWRERAEPAICVI
jgi:hypothetical protein